MANSRAEYRMTGNHSRVPNRANDNQTFADGAFDQFAQRTIQVRLFKVAAGGNVNDTNLVLFPVF